MDHRLARNLFAGLVAYLLMVGLAWAFAPLIGYAFGMNRAIGWAISLAFTAAAIGTGLKAAALANEL